MSDAPVLICYDGSAGAAAIVLGSRGLNGPRGVFEGSVSHQVAAHARQPVLIVPPVA